MAHAESPEPTTGKSEKKHRKDKSHKSEKKRAREDDDGTETHRKHKKSKSVAEEPEAQPHDSLSNGDGERKHKKDKKKKKRQQEDTNDSAEVEASSSKQEPAASEEKKEKRKKKSHGHAKEEQAVDADGLESERIKADKKKHKKKHRETNGEEPAALEEDEPKEEEKKREKKKKHREAELEGGEQPLDDKAERKKKKKSKKHDTDDGVEAEAEADAEADAMEVDAVEEPAKSSRIHQPSDIPANPEFPFFTQTVSLYEPLYPVGFDLPITNAKAQHLRHLQNTYVTSLHGVLLDYRNVTLGEEPSRNGAAADDASPALVRSQDEYAVGFGWITADVDLFVPSRGAFMEGRVNLQTEGHIGVVCFGRFNASIEAERLPEGWTWVSNEDAGHAGGFEETASVITADEHGVARAVHSTGYWTDARGEKVRGKLRFRIRDFDAGTSGDSSYLSLEGTMLDLEAEKALVRRETEALLKRKGKGPGRRERRAAAADFSVTRFAVDGEQPQDQGEEPQPELYKASRAGSEE